MTSPIKVGDIVRVTWVLDNGDPVAERAPVDPEHLYECEPLTHSTLTDIDAASVMLERAHHRIGELTRAVEEANANLAKSRFGDHDLPMAHELAQRLTKAEAEAARLTEDRDSACAARDEAVKAHREAIAAAEQVTRRAERDRDAAVRNCAIVQSRLDSELPEAKRRLSEVERGALAVARGAMGSTGPETLPEAAARVVRERDELRDSKAQVIADILAAGARCGCDANYLSVGGVLETMARSAGAYTGMLKAGWDPEYGTKLADMTAERDALRAQLVEARQEATEAWSLLTGNESNNGRRPGSLLAAVKMAMRTSNDRGVERDALRAKLATRERELMTERGEPGLTYVATHKPEPNWYDPGARPAKYDLLSPSEAKAWEGMVADEPEPQAEKAADPHASPYPWCVADAWLAVEAPRWAEGPCKLVSHVEWSTWEAVRVTGLRCRVQADGRYRPATPEETARFEAELAKNTLKVGQRWVWAPGLMERGPQRDDRIVSLEGGKVVTEADFEGRETFGRVCMTCSEPIRAGEKPLHYMGACKTDAAPTAPPEPKTSLPVLPKTCGECEHAVRCSCQDSVGKQCPDPRCGHPKVANGNDGNGWGVVGRCPPPPSCPLRHKLRQGEP